MTKTVVDMRSTRVPARFWKDPVRYDAWGSPYATDGDRFIPYVVALHPNGKTCDRHIEWRLSSGPDVTFPDGSAPSRGWHPSEAPRP